MAVRRMVWEAAMAIPEKDRERVLELLSVRRVMAEMFGHKYSEADLNTARRILHGEVVARPYNRRDGIRCRKVRARMVR